MDHGAGVAVKIAHEVVDHKVAQHGVCIQDLLQVRPLTELFEGGDEPLLIRLAYVGLGVVENVRIAVRVIVNILKLDIVIACPASSASIHAVRLVEFPVAAAVIAPQEGLFHPLYRQIQPPVLSVDRQIDIAAQGRGHTEVPHQPVHQVVLHHGVVLNQIVEVQLIQAIIGLGAVVVVKFHFEAVPIIAVGGNRGEGVVPLRPDRRAAVGLAVNDQRALSVLLILAGL